MHAGKPQDQSLAIAYNVKRKSKKMAQGGEISASNESRPMPEAKHNDSKQVSHNSGKKELKQSDWTGKPTVAQAQRPSKTMMSEPKMAESNVIKAHIIKNLIDQIAPNGGSSQPDKSYDEKGANRQGPESRDLHMKKMAEGGLMSGSNDMDENERHQGKSQVSMEFGSGPENDELEHPTGLEEDNDQKRPSMSDYMSDHEQMLAEGGMIDENEQPQPEEDEEHHDSIAAAIMSKRRKMAEGGMADETDAMESRPDKGYGAIIVKKYADGGQVDLSRNADEDPNNEDQMSFEALKKENYSESEGLSQLDQPEDSNLKGNPREEDEENEHDMVSSIRRKMKSQRQF